MDPSLRAHRDEMMTSRDPRIGDIIRKWGLYTVFIRKEDDPELIEGEGKDLYKEISFVLFGDNPISEEDKKMLSQFCMYWISK